jgi:hypothetical protein
MKKNINTQTYAGVDILKFVIAFLPVAQHSLFEHSFITVEDHTLAVPYFFIVSGFLLGKKMERIQSLDDRKKELLRRALILFRLWGKWILIYLPIAVYFYWIIKSAPCMVAIKNYVCHILLCGDTVGYGWHLWFIYSMGVIHIVYMALLYRYRWSCFMLLLFFAALHLIYYLWFDSITDSRVSFLVEAIIKRTFGGGLYITSGLYLYRLAQYLGNKCKLIIAGISSLSVCYILNTLNQPFAALAGGSGLFLFAMSLPLKSSEFTLRLRNQSMWIYYIHMYFVFLYHEACRHSVCHFYSLNCFLFAAILSLIVSYIAVKLQEKPAFSWLEELVKCKPK